MSGRSWRKRKPRKVRNLHAKIANRRLDFLHKESTRLVNDCELIVVGDVSSSKLTKTNMAKSVNDAGWSMFRHFLEYKAIARKVVYREVSERFTTQACSCCGAIGGPKGRKGLEVREWVCGECGAVLDRDLNAAKNILKFGLDTLTPDLKRAQESRKPTARRGKDVDGAKMTTLTDSHRSARLT